MSTPLRLATAEISALRMAGVALAAPGSLAASHAAGRESTTRATTTATVAQTANPSDRKW